MTFDRISISSDKLKAGEEIRIPLRLVSYLWDSPHQKREDYGEVEILKESLLTHGQQEAIEIWLEEGKPNESLIRSTKEDTTKYYKAFIQSGHTRKRAFQRIYEEGRTEIKEIRARIITKPKIEDQITKQLISQAGKKYNEVELYQSFKTYLEMKAQQQKIKLSEETEERLRQYRELLNMSLASGSTIKRRLATAAQIPEQKVEAILEIERISEENRNHIKEGRATLARYLSLKEEHGHETAEKILTEMAVAGVKRGEEANNIIKKHRSSKNSKKLNTEINNKDLSEFRQAKKKAEEKGGMILQELGFFTLFKFLLYSISEQEDVQGAPELCRIRVEREILFACVDRINRIKENEYLIFDRIKRAIEAENIKEMKRVLQEWILEIEKSEEENLAAPPGVEYDDAQSHLSQSPQDE